MTRALIVLLLMTSAALAQAPDASALEASGNKHFELAEYDAAIKDFKEAFRISDSPGYLYNIAQANRLKGDCREAATFYKNYLRREPNAPNAAKVRDRIKEMDECAAKQPAAPTTSAPAPAPTEPAQPTQQPLPAQPETPDQPSSSWMKYAGYVALGVGAVGIGVGIKFMLDGNSANDKLQSECMVSCSSNVALAIQEDGKAANRNALIFGIAGGVVAAGGVALVVLSMRSGASEPVAASVSLTRGGALASYAWRF